MRTRQLPVSVLLTHLIDDTVSRVLSKVNRQQLGSLILVCAATICFFVSTAQSNIKFTHLTNLDGLSQSTVQAIAKDKYGFIWFGTQDGLNRYDGYSFKVYRHQPKDSTSLRTSHILTLHTDHDQNLWVGTANGGLSRYDHERDAFIHYKESTDTHEGLSHKTVTAIHEDKQNNLWVGTHWKLNLLDRKTGKVTQFAHDPADAGSISSNGISCITEDSRGNLWVGTYEGLNKFDRKSKKFNRYVSTDDPASISSNTIRTIYEDAKGRLWIGTNKGLNLFDPSKETFKRCQINTDSQLPLGEIDVTAIDDAANGKLWVGTLYFLGLFDVDGNMFTQFSSNPNIPTTLNKNGNVTAMMYDKGILWVGTSQGAINKYDESLTYFHTYTNNPTNELSLSFNVVTSFAEKTDGDIWISTAGGALNLWDRKKNIFNRYFPDTANKNSLSSWGLLCLWQSKKNNYLWIGNYGNCMDRYDAATNTFKHYTKGDAPDQLNNDAVYALFEDSKGNIWMGTNGGGANVLDQETGIITKYVTDPNNNRSISGNFIRCFTEDKNGNIWIGSSAGVSVFDPQTRRFTRYTQDNIALESDVIYSLYEDNKGNMWIGTLGGGLNKFDLQTKKLTIYTTNEGLPDNTINNIVEDGKGYLWLSTNNGLSRFDPRTAVFDNSSLDNGIQSLEYSLGAGLKTNKGEILFGGINGFNIVDPGNLRKNNTPPPVVITDFKLFNKHVAIAEDGSPLKKSILETKEITLSYNQSIITFEFTALGFTAPEKNQYAYMLEGFDKDWNYAGNERRATYTNLNPGEYVFRVKASNNDGLWNEKGTSIVLTILPPFWQTWWFKLLAGATLIGIVLLIYKIRVRAIHAQKALLEQQVQERTQSLALMTLEERKARQQADEANKELEKKNIELEQFAYIASHDLQEPLRTTSTSAELLERKYKGKLDESADKCLSFIIHSTDRMRVLISDLLDYSRIGKKKELMKVDCKEIVQAVVSDLGTAIDEAGAIIKVNELPVLDGYSTEIKQLFQNLIINAVKFRKKGVAPDIRIESEKTDGYWKFSVSDNGIGMDPQYGEKIFAIFQRLHTRNEYPGSGIGLSHCKKIAELHKGKIWVDSAPGQGSTFHFTIKENIDY
jgi:ligand-binding sensor domain-containing protein/signal transduction histidine kinase